MGVEPMEEKPLSEPKLTPIMQVHKSTLKNEISNLIKDMILTNRLQPGQPIVIDKLAEEFGVSHTPVREALAMLERDGLIVLNSYKNPQVADVTAKDVTEVFEMRLMTESWAVERAALNLSDAQIDRIDQMLQVARKEAGENNFAPHLKADLLLHETIMRSTHNELFWKVAQRIHERSIHVRALVEASGTAQEIYQIIDEHELIIQALRARDPGQARKAMVAHLEGGEARTLRVLEKNLSSEGQFAAQDSIG
jgi:DNA-binding GntR family transcriptional regulator